jgi:mannopine transport system ATP-binding protein
MIAGFELPTSGRIVIDGRDVTHTPPNRRGVGMVFQRYALFPHMTVAQNIGFPLKMRRLGQALIAEKVEQALAMVRLGGYGGRLPAQLSGGQQQRVAVARALVFEPPVLLMDEPLGALDKKLREELQIEIKAIQERFGVTVIYVTHDQQEALTMSDRVAVMDGGRIVQIGTPTALYRDPANAFVADFIGKMNFIRGRVRHVEGGTISVDVGADGRVEVPAQRAAESFKPDSMVEIAARPEHVALKAAGSGERSALRGEIETSIFAGAHRVALVRLKGVEGAPVEVQLPASTTGGFERGDAVDVILDTTALRLFPARTVA